jgi:hypothetical protein
MLPLLTVIGSRTMDKNLGVRAAALNGLAKIFATHCSTYWKDGRPLPTISKSFSWIPRRLFKAKPHDSVMFSILDELLDMTLLGGQKFTVSERTNVFVGLYASMQSEVDCGTRFIGLFMYKQKLHEKMLGILDHLSQTDAALAVNPSSLEKFNVVLEEKCSDFIQLSGIFSSNRDKAVVNLLKLLRHKNKKIHKMLRALCDPCLGYTQIIAQSNALAAAGRLVLKETSKVAAAGGREFTQLLSKRLAFNAVNSEVLPILFALINSYLNSARIRLCPPTLEILHKVAKVCPRLAWLAIKHMIPLLLHQDPTIVTPALRCLSFCKPDQADGIECAENISLTENERSHLKRVLFEIFARGFENQAKLAARILFVFFGQNESITGEFNHLIQQNVQPILQRLAEDFNLEAKKKKSATIDGSKPFENNLEKIAALIRGVSEIVLICPDCLHVAEKMIALLKTTVFTSNSQIYLNTQRYAIKLIVNFLISLASSQLSETEIVTQGSPHIGFLLAIVSLQGELPIAHSPSTASEHSVRGKSASPKSPSKLGARKSKDKRTPQGSPEDKSMPRLRAQLALSAAKAVIKLCGTPIYQTMLASAPISSAIPSPDVTPKTDPDNRNRMHESRLQMSSDLIRAGRFTSRSDQLFALKDVLMVAHNDFEIIRSDFLAYVQKRLLLNKLPFAYSALLAYVASERPSDLKDRFQNLVRIIQRQRQIVRNRESRHSISDAHTRSTLLPEFALADLVYFLSYHEDFDDGDDCMQYFQKFIKMYVEALLCNASANNSQNNVSLILDITLAIRNSQDARDSQNIKIYMLAEMAQLVVQSVMTGSQIPDSTREQAVLLPVAFYRQLTQKPKKNRYLPESFTLITESFRKGNHRADDAQPESDEVRSKSPPKLQAKQPAETDAKKQPSAPSISANRQKPKTARDHEGPGSVSVKDPLVKTKKKGGPTCHGDFTKKILSEKKDEVIAFKDANPEIKGAHLVYVANYKKEHAEDFAAFEAIWKEAHPKTALKSKAKQASSKSREKTIRGKRKIEPTRASRPRSVKAVVSYNEIEDSDLSTDVESSIAPLANTPRDHFTHSSQESPSSPSVSTPSSQEPRHKKRKPSGSLSSPPEKIFAIDAKLQGIPSRNVIRPAEARSEISSAGKQGKLLVVSKQLVIQANPRSQTRKKKSTSKKKAECKIPPRNEKRDSLSPDPEASLKPACKETDDSQDEPGSQRFQMDTAMCTLDDSTSAVRTVYLHGLSNI